MTQPQTDRRSEPVRTLVAIGDSITAGASASSQEKCWVSLVARMLEEAQGRRIETINSGIGGNVITTECPNLQRTRIYIRHSHLKTQWQVSAWFISRILL